MTQLFSLFTPRGGITTIPDHETWYNIDAVKQWRRRKEHRQINAGAHKACAEYDKEEKYGAGN